MTDRLDRMLDAADLDLDAEDLRLDRETLRQLASQRRLIRQMEERLLATLDDINALVAKTGTDAQRAADRVIAAIQAATNAASAQIADLQTQVQTLIDGNAADITPAQLQSVADGLAAVDTTIEGIAPATPVTPV